MKILLFGGSGQLGTELRVRAADLHFSMVAPVTSEVDVANQDQVVFLARQVAPDVIINAAAYTAVDKAEEDREAAFRVNRDGAEFIAIAAKETRARLIHISTDYVFDGSGSTPISESEPTNPINVYGESKLAGEEAIRKILDNAVIVRTSSLYGQKGVNFVRTMLELFTTRTELKVVNDQWMSPTWAGWLAEVVLDLLRLPPWQGTLHASCSGAATWFEFANEILRLAGPHLPNRMVEKIEPVSAAEFGRPARRPRYSVFDGKLLAEVIGRPPITWQRGLQLHLQSIGLLSDGSKKERP